MNALFALGLAADMAVAFVIGGVAEYRTSRKLKRILDETNKL